ncbi:unnamed protein product [Linum tenue]|uniref:Uncharacterized protein n=1 Tax=Linum tenue TaxID=586396 RepID=A0AAV0H8V4_9ROSI|nr:unnamed protein product [Linum tenue]
MLHRSCKPGSMCAFAERQSWRSHRRSE